MRTAYPLERGTWRGLSTRGRRWWLREACDRHFARPLPWPAHPADTTFVLAGEDIVDLTSLLCALGEAVSGPGGYFGGTLVALEDCLAGGFGMTLPSNVVWMNHTESRRRMDHRERAEWAQRLIHRREHLDEEGLRWLQDAADEARARRGPTMFDAVREVLTSGSLRLVLA